MKYTHKKNYLTTTTNTTTNNIATSDMILDQLNHRKLDRQQASINSAAIQDHIMKNFNLGNLDPFKKKPIRHTGLSNNGRNIIGSANN